MGAAEAPRRKYRMVARAEQRSRTRQSLVDSMKQAIWTTPYPAIRVAELARSAGVSSQTLYAHFATKDDLFLAAMAELGPEVLHLRGDPAPGDIQAIARGLVRVYEATGDGNWWLLPLERESPTIAQVLAMGRAGHREWLEDVFAPLLPSPSGSRRRMVDALYAATDVGTWKLLRRDLGLSRARTESVIVTLIRGIVAPPQNKAEQP